MYARWSIKVKLVIALDVIKQNLLKIKSRVNLPIMLMLKANAYGFSSVRVAHATQNIVNAFGVVSAEEGTELRENGIDKDILVCACASYELPIAVENNLIISLHNISQLYALLGYIEHGEIDASRVRVHLKVDSGMCRLGFKDVEEPLKLLTQYNINVEGVFSHLRDGTISQKPTFEQLSSMVINKYPNAIRHIASSHSLYDKRLQYDLVRVGIRAYSGAMSLHSQIIDIHRVEKGDMVGYGANLIDKDTNIATVFGGYADGLFGSKRVWIDGRECNVVGNICMDTFMVDVKDMKCHVGQDVLIFDDNTKDIVSKDREIIEYMLYTSTYGRVQRCYLDD